MRSFLLVGFILSNILLPMPRLCFAKTQIAVQLSLNWEGRAIQEPNIEALRHLRKTFEGIPLTHLINPVYFLDEGQSSETMQFIQQLVAPDDEVGLYLSPVEGLVRAAGLILKLQPSFWGYIDEGELCQSDCGLDVPLTVYNREEVLKLLARAHHALQEAGFAKLRSFAVRGWLEAPFVSELAAAFGYGFDLSPVDPHLLAAKLREFPIAAWVTQRWTDLLDSDPEAAQRLVNSNHVIQYVPQMGGVLELNEQREILRRFDQLVKDRNEHPNLSQAFTLSLSVETAFQTWPKLRVILQSIQERAKSQDLELIFTTPSSAKNGRPTAANVAIRTSL